VLLLLLRLFLLFAHRFRRYFELCQLQLALESASSDGPVPSESKRISGSKSTLGVRAMIVIVLFYVCMYSVFLMAITVVTPAKSPQVVPLQFSVAVFFYIPIATVINSTWGDGKPHARYTGSAQQV